MTAGNSCARARLPGLAQPHRAHRQPSIDAVETFLDLFRLLAEPAAEVTSVHEAPAPLPAADESVNR